MDELNAGLSRQRGPLRPRVCALAVFVFLVALACEAVASGGDVDGIPVARSIAQMGVPPDSMARYTGKQFACLTSNHGAPSPPSPPRTIAMDAVNDGFCDCPDGSDEPGTSACENATFYCYNKEHLPSTILSSRVNDGICDSLLCCDGSDEYDVDHDGKVTFKCPNVCGSRAKEHRLAEEADKAKRIAGNVQRLADAKKGAMILEAYKLKAFSAHESKISEASAETARHRKALEALTQQLEKSRKSEVKVQSRTKSDLARAQTTKKGFEDVQHSADNAKKLLESNDLESMRSALKSVVESVESFFFSHQDTLNEDSTEQQETLKETLDKSASLDDDILESTRVTMEEEEKVPETSAQKKPILWPSDYSFVLRNPENHPLTARIFTAAKLLWDPASLSTMASVVQREKKLKLLLAEAERVENKLKLEFEKAKEFLALEFRQPEFVPLHGECYGLTTPQYVYSICPFKSVTQRPRQESGGGGGHEITLGSWPGSWVNDRTWLFDKGQQCYHGQARTATVTLECSSKPEVLFSDEPQPCTYTFKLGLPALCHDD